MMYDCCAIATVQAMSNAQEIKIVLCMSIPVSVFRDFYLPGTPGTLLNVTRKAADTIERAPISTNRQCWQMKPALTT